MLCVKGSTSAVVGLVDEVLLVMNCVEEVEAVGVDLRQHISLFSTCLRSFYKKKKITLLVEKITTLGGRAPFTYKSQVVHSLFECKSVKSLIRLSCNPIMMR